MSHSVSAAFKAGALALLTALPLSSTLAHNLEIHGSNTVGATLAPMLVTGHLEHIGSGAVKTDSTGVENEKILSIASEGGTVSVLVAAHGSSTGFRTLANGQADIWASSRPVKPAEVEQVKSEADLTALDRKSTRLNSSHVRISYAVFCLKK